MSCKIFNNNNNKIKITNTIAGNKNKINKISNNQDNLISNKNLKKFYLFSINKNDTKFTNLHLTS